MNDANHDWDGGVGCSNAEEFEAERLSASIRFQKAEASAIAAQHELIDVTKRYALEPYFLYSSLFAVIMNSMINRMYESFLLAILVCGVLVTQSGTFSYLSYTLLLQTVVISVLSA